MPDQQKSSSQVIVACRSPVLITSPAEDLLDLYLSLPKKQREQRFSDTAHAAEMTGLSIRTIQLWIERGVVHAVPVGKKYQVELSSLRDYLKRQVEKRA